MKRIIEKRHPILNTMILLVLATLFYGCHEDEVIESPKVSIISPDSTTNSFKEGEVIEIVLSVHAEGGLSTLYQADTLIYQWDEGEKIDEVMFTFRVSDDIDLLAFKLVDVRGEEAFTTFSGTYVALPSISVVSPSLTFGLRPEVGDETTIVLALSAQAGMKVLRIDGDIAEEWDSDKLEDQFSYTFTPQDNIPYDLKFSLVDEDGDQSTELIINVKPKITVSVTFTVDMAGVDISRGVFIAGEGLGFGVKTMTHQGNNIYTYSTSLIAGTEGHYYFLNGDEFAGIYYKYREEIPVRCGTSITDVAPYRSFTIGKDDRESGVMYSQTWGKCNDSGSKERIFFFGDSITALGNWEGGYIQHLEDLLVGLGLSKDLIGVGISGNTVVDLQNRVQWDIVESSPSTVIVYVGINDLWVSDADQFKLDYDDLITTLKPTGAQIILVTPAVVGEKKNGENPDDTKLDLFAGQVRVLATENSLELIDLRRVFVDYLGTNNPNNDWDGILTTDGVHMNDLGNQLIAETMVDFIK